MAKHLRTSAVRASALPQRRKNFDRAAIRTVLPTEPGQRKSVFRYNHSEEYVDLVLSIMQAYTEGDYTSVPNYIRSRSRPSALC